MIIGYGLFLVTTIGITTAWMYYQGYNIDNGYENVSSSANFHVYQPTYIPQGRKQISKYHLLGADELAKLFESDTYIPNTAVKTYFDYPLANFNQHEGSTRKKGMIVFIQAPIESSFDILKHLQSVEGDVEKDIQELRLNSNTAKVAYIDQTPDSIIVQLWLITNDNVLIGFISPGSVDIIPERIEELVSMAESLE